MVEELVKYEAEEQQLQRAQNTAPLILRPAVSIDQMIQRRELVLGLLRRVMTKDVDYGQIPGTPRPTLYKPGAEKLAGFFGLRAIVEPVKIEERWGTDTEEPFFYYKYRCTVYLGDTVITTYDGLAHSHEDKYRWRWVPEADVPFHLDKSQLIQKIGKATELKFAVDKAETSGKYGKPVSHWKMFHDAVADGTAKAIKKKTRGGKEMPAWVIDSTVWRIPNPSVEDLPHTISAIAQKRSMVGGVRIATNATDIFTVSDYVGEENSDVIEGQYEERPGRVDMKADTRTYQNDPDQTVEDAIGDLYGHPIKKKNGNGVKPVDAIRKAFGAAEGKDVPPEDKDLEQFQTRMTKLMGKDGVADFCENTFGKTVGGLSAAHITAIMAQDDDTIKAV